MTLALVRAGNLVQGILCPVCRSTRLKVLDSRPRGTRRRRRYRCEHAGCGCQFVTFETIYAVLLAKKARYERLLPGGRSISGEAVAATSAEPP